MSISIGRLRRILFLPFNCKWNAWVRDATARLEGGWLVKSTVLFALALPLAGCANGDNFATGALVGGAAGAVGGAVVGSALAAPRPYYAPAPVYYEPRPYWRGGYGYRGGYRYGHRRGW